MTTQKEVLEHATPEERERLLAAEKALKERTAMAVAPVQALTTIAEPIDRALTELLDLGARFVAADVHVQRLRDRHMANGIEGSARFRAFERTIPEAYESARFPDPFIGDRERGDRTVARPPEMLAIARESIHAKRVVLMGTAGAGKTRTAIAMLRARFAEEFARYGERAIIPRIVSAMHLSVARLQHRAGQGEAPLVTSAINTPLLLLDDLGSEERVESSACAFVLWDRAARARPIWVTTGLSARELGARYGGGMVRRFFESAVIIRCAREVTH